MKLYYTPGTCSLSPHIIFRETGLPCQLEYVDLKTHRLTNGEDYYAISERGQVPLLELEDGQRLREGAVIAQFIAERAGREDLLPPVGDIRRYRVLEWQHFIGSELHKSYSPLFGDLYPEEAKDILRSSLRQKYEWVERQIEDRKYLTGNDFTVADAYLFTVTRWAEHTGVNLSDLNNISNYQLRVGKRAPVLDALYAENLSG